MKSELSRFLEGQLERINYWLSFAEAKNAALLAFNVAIICILADHIKVYTFWNSSILVFFLISCVVSFFSFFPRKRINKPAARDHQNPNLLFWNDVAAFSEKNEFAKSYAKAVIDRYFGEDVSPQQLDLDLAEEIVINSHIAKYKYKYFSIALVLDATALIISVVLIVAA